MPLLRVSDAEKLISTEPILVREEASICETVERLIDTRHARCAYVVDEQGRLMGIVTLNALVEHIFAHHYFEGKTAGGTIFDIIHTENALQLATPQPVFVTEKEPLHQAVAKMLNSELEEIPVVDEEGVVVGDINLLDLLSVWIESNLESRQRAGHEQVRLARYVHEDSVTLRLRGRKKQAVLDEMLAVLGRAPQVVDMEALKQVVKTREVLVTTGVGRGVAIPHGRCKGVHDCVIAIGLSEKGIDFDSMDGKPVHIVFLIAAPEEPGYPYAQVLSRIMRLLHSEETQQQLLGCKSSQQVIGLLEEFDRQWESRTASMTH